MIISFFRLSQKVPNPINFECFFYIRIFLFKKKEKKNHKIDRYRSLFSNLYDPLRIQTSHDPKETISTAKFKNGEA